MHYYFIKIKLVSHIFILLFAINDTSFVAKFNNFKLRQVTAFVISIPLSIHQVGSVL